MSATSTTSLNWWKCALSSCSRVGPLKSWTSTVVWRPLAVGARRGVGQGRTLAGGIAAAARQRFARCVRRRVRRGSCCCGRRGFHFSPARGGRGRRVLGGAAETVRSARRRRRRPPSPSCAAFWRQASWYLTCSATLNIRPTKSVALSCIYRKDSCSMASASLSSCKGGGLELSESCARR